MAGIFGTFEDVKKLASGVVLLIVIAFLFGFCAGRKSANKQPSTNRPKLSEIHIPYSFAQQKPLSGEKGFC
jgi:hypothetical protein